MNILRQDAPVSLDHQLKRACADSRAVLVLAHGATGSETLEPFATLADVLEGLDKELALVLADGWTTLEWARQCDGALDQLAPTPDQRRRALTQQVADGRVEVLFIERGRIVGSALTLVAQRRREGPIALNTKVAAMELLQAARDALQWEPRGMQRLVKDAREALGIPAGPMTTIAAVREQRGDQPSAVSRPVQDIGESIRRATQKKTTPAPAPPAPPKPHERHSIVGATCTACGRSGAALNAPCGRPDLGRFGVIELD